MRGKKQTNKQTKLKHCKLNVAGITSLKSANRNLTSAWIKSLGQWHFDLSVNGYHDVCHDNGGWASLHAWRMKQSQSWLRWNTNVQSRFAVLHFGDGRLHEVLKGPQGVFEGGAHFRRRAGDALHQRGVQSDHLSPYVTVHWWREKWWRRKWAKIISVKLKDGRVC